MKKTVLLLTLLTLLVCVNPAYALAPHGTTPHNENGNRTLDLYWTQNFDGYMHRLIQSYHEPKKDLDQAPLPRRVLNINRADIHVIKQPCADDGNSESFFGHKENETDIVSMGSCVANPNYVLEHEVLHGESMGHHGDLCDSILIDETVGIKSFMCPKRTDIAKLPQHDKVDLRGIPNKREGFAATTLRAATAGDEPGGDFRIEETFPTTIPDEKAD